MIWRRRMILRAAALLAPALAGGAPAGEPAPVTKMTIAPVDAAEFFTVPERETVLRLRAAPAPSAPLAFRVRGYAASAVTASGAVSFRADGTGELRLRLPAGYHEILIDPPAPASVPAAEAPADPERTPAVFGVCSLPPPPAAPDPYFAIDTAMTWLETRPAVRDQLVAGLRRAGLTRVRERLSLGAVNPEPGKWRTGGARDAFAMRALYARHRIEVLEIFCGAPAWMDPAPASPFPRDWSAIAADFAALPPEIADTCHAWEIWNEPDLLRLPGDQYATAVRAVAYALRRAWPRARVVTGVFATAEPGAYAETCAENGMVELSDAVSVHNYNRAALLGRSVGAYRRLFAARGRPAMPYWLTESGLPWTIGTPRPAAAQAAECALETAAKAVAGRAAGIAVHYAFVYPYYEEGGVHNFAMLGREATPLRSLAAYAWCARALAGAESAGALSLPEPPDAPPLAGSWVFRTPAGELLWVPYAGDTAAVPLRLPPVLAQGVRRAVGIDGRALPLPAAGADWVLPDGMAYLYLDPALKSLVTPAADPAPGADRPATAPAAVFPHFRFADAPVTRAVNSYLVSGKQAAAFRLPLRIFNLSPETRTEEFTVRLPGGRTLPPRKFTVPGTGYLDAEWPLDLRGELSPARARYLRVEPAGYHGAEAAVRTLAVPLLLQAELAEHLQGHAKAVPLPLRETARWKKNIVGHGSMEIRADAAGVNLDFRFTRPGQRWAYPHFILPRPAGEMLPGARGFIVRARSHGGGRNVFLWAVDAGGPFMSGELFPADGRWHVAWVPFGEFSPAPQHPERQNAQFAPATVHTLYLGMLSDDAANTLTVSDIYLAGD